MKVLILSHNTGGGHNSISETLKEELNRNGVESCVAYANIPLSDVVYSKKYNLYNEITKKFI